MRAPSVLAILLVLSSAWAAWAAAEKEDRWRRRVEAGLNVTQGNKDSSSERVDLGIDGRGRKWQSEFNLEGVVGKTDGEKDREKVTARASYARDLSERVYTSVTLEYLYDAIADVDYRFVASPALGLYLIRDDAQALRAELGPAYITEKKAGEKDSYPALRLAELYACKITRVSRLKQAIEYLPDLRENQKYLLNARLELESDLDDNLALGVKLESSYDSEPAEGKEKQDTTFSTSLKFRF